jgi:hypothetical protein
VKDSVKLNAASYRFFCHLTEEDAEFGISAGGSLVAVALYQARAGRGEKEVANPRVSPAETPAVTKALAERLPGYLVRTLIKEGAVPFEGGLTGALLGAVVEEDIRYADVAEALLRWWASRAEEEAEEGEAAGK